MSKFQIALLIIGWMYSLGALASFAIMAAPLAPNPDYPKYVITILVVNMVCAGRFIHRVMLKEMVRTQ